MSSKLSNGEFDELEGLVEPSLLSELKHRLSSFSVAQQDLLRVATEDIFFSFPYQIGIIIPDSPPDMGILFLLLYFISDYYAIHLMY